MKNNDLLESYKGLLKGEPNYISALSNSSAFIFQNFSNLNWAGFYLFDGEKLTVGPFQGKVACSTIELSRGVCGKAATLKKTVVVPNVHDFIGHIACDELSLSEVVIPIIQNDRLIGVLDIDSPIENRFDEALVNLLENLVFILVKTIDFTSL